MDAPDPTSLLRPAQAWLKLLDGGAVSPLAKRFAALHGLSDGDALNARLAALYAEVVTVFAERFGAETPCLLVRAPARVNLMGMHIDHRGGAINPIALLETALCVAPRNNDRVVIENADAKYPRREFVISQELPKARVLDWEAWTRERYAERKKAGTAGDWSDYVRAALLYYQNRHKGPTGQMQVDVPGMNMVFGSIVPAAAGLSSSSAMVVATLTAALALTGEGTELPVEDLIDWCGDAEWFVGTRGGKGDHASILCGRPAAVLHLEFFPTRVQPYNLGADAAIVLANSLVEAKKSDGARDFFNQRIAGYVIGEHLLKKLDPERFAERPNLASCTPRRAGYAEPELYRLLKQVPESMTRKEALAALPKAADALARIFDSHAEPKEGYEVRQILLFGLAEVERSDRGPEVLAKGDVAGFGELMNLSHDGDRIVSHQIGKDGRVGAKTKTDHRVPDKTLDTWIKQEAPLWRQPGGYDACVEETDLLADLARSVEGVHGARLIGAGRGGCVGILCRRSAVKGVLERLRTQYYEPRGLPGDAAFVASPCQGAGVITP